MNLPLFSVQDAPGPDFNRLLASSGVAPSPIDGALDPHDYRHGTTCVAIRFGDGVLLAGDRRATSGNLISHRTLEKVFPADRHSGVAIAGAAGPAIEMVKLFQLQLEHYEKVEGTALSLEGKASQLSQMLRGNLPLAMQGMVVVPIFAGFDLTRGEGRLYEFDVTGGRYEEADHASTGSGSLPAGPVEAADEASATGGPDPIRGSYPIVATITADGYTRISHDDLAARTQALIARRQGN